MISGVSNSIEPGVVKAIRAEHHNLVIALIIGLISIICSSTRFTLMIESFTGEA